MSFSDEVKQELIHHPPEWDCCARAEICAAVLLSGHLSFRGAGKYGVGIKLGRVSASRYYYTLIKKHMGISADILTRDYRQLGDKTGVELNLRDEDVDGAMDALMLRDENALFGIATLPNAEIIKNPCCKAAFLKSAFMICGSVSSPEKAYHLSLAVSSEEAAECLQSLMADRGIAARVSTNRNKYVTYLKSAEGVSAFLTLTGASAARLKIENLRIVKDIKNETNRRTNCDNNNIERSVKSAQSQIEDILLIARSENAENLPPQIREMMSLRLENPESSLSELGELCDPPIGKSGVNNRLRKIGELAGKIREGNRSDAY